MTQYTFTSLEDGIECTLKFEAEQLDEVCTRFAQFLNGAGFSYVEEVEAIKRGGCE